LPIADCRLPIADWNITFSLNFPNYHNLQQQQVFLVHKTPPALWTAGENS
jgi:hypothetical protein